MGRRPKAWQELFDELRVWQQIANETGKQCFLCMPQEKKKRGRPPKKRPNAASTPTGGDSPVSEILPNGEVAPSNQVEPTPPTSG